MGGAGMRPVGGVIALVLLALRLLPAARSVALPSAVLCVMAALLLATVAVFALIPPGP